MRSMFYVSLGTVALILTLGNLEQSIAAPGGILTLQAGSSPPAAIPLVQHTNLWRYRKGTNEPPANWHSVSDLALDATWLTGPGGIGMADGDDGTELDDMFGRYFTVYIRRTFTVNELADTNALLRLVMDWDDGFVAYLDGTEIARSPNVLSTPHPYNQGVSPDHPAVADGGSLGIFDLGPAGTWLTQGDHVLAVQGINGDTNSSDLTLNADLLLVDSSSGGTFAGGFFTLVEADSIALFGTNTVLGSSRVVVNGEDASFNIAAGTWSKIQSLEPGLNRLFVGALAPDGRVVSSLTRDFVSELSSVSVSGSLAGSNYWSETLGTVRVVSDVVIEQGASLAIDAGTVVLLSPGVSIQARTNGTFSVLGTDSRPVYFLPADGTNAWGRLSAEGSDAVLDCRHAEIVAGQLRVSNDGTLTLEDCLVRNRYGPLMLEGNRGRQLTLRRTHLNFYEQTHIDYTPALVEDCLFENITSDAMDFLGYPAEIVIRRVTWRHGFGGNTDAIDLGGNRDVLIEGNLIHDFPDKGVSIADQSNGTRIRNSLIYNTGSAINCYASSNCVFEQTTVANSGYGIHLYIRPGHVGPGHATGTNLISWGNTVPLEVIDGSTFALSYSDIEGASVYPGLGNINGNPLFADAAVNNFQLNPGSPASGAGLGGTDMGVLFPVGGLPPAPFDLSATGLSSSEIQVRWQEDADNEAGFAIERSADGVSWQTIGQAAANTDQYLDSELGAGEAYYYRARATNDSGISRASNLARATTRSLPVMETIVGGTLTGHTTWDASMGTIKVLSSVIVPDQVVLTIREGAQIRLTNNMSLRAQGGIINILGTAADPVSIRSLGAANWDQLVAQGTNASLTIRHADITQGRLQFLDGAWGLVEDSHIHNFYSGSTPIIHSYRATAVTLRRCHVAYYHETLFQITLSLLEDCLFENATNPSSDGLDFDGARPGSTIRRCTFRNGMQTNTDAIDIGPTEGVSSVDVVIEDCLMHHFSDKGVSIGENSFNITVRNCLIYNTDRGVQVKDVSTATVHDCTIVDSAIGLHAYEKVAGTGGGRFTNTYNNILAYDAAAIAVEPDSVMVVNYSDTYGTNWPGTANLNLDPQFQDPAARDYRLRTNSPCLTTGFNGTTMGVSFPVGGLPHAPGALQIIAAESTAVTLAWVDAGDYESGFVVEKSADNSSWLMAATTPANVSTAVISPLLPGQVYFFRVKGTNFIGDSFYSDVVTTSGHPGDTDGDGMPDAWELAHGFNPNNAGDASLDADDDGTTNVDEYRAGTNPWDPLSVFRIDSIRIASPGSVQIQFIAQSNRVYYVQFRDSLTAGDWQILTDVPASEQPRVFTVTDSPPPTVRTRFYRLFIPGQP